MLAKITEPSENYPRAMCNGLTKGVYYMKNSKKKIGKVLLKEIKSKKWQVCWLDPVTRKYVRRTLPYTKLPDVE